MEESVDIIVYTGGAKAYAPRRMVEEGAKRGIKIAPILYRDLNFILKDGSLEMIHEGHTPFKTKGVFIRGLGEDSVYNPYKYYIIHWHKNHGAKVLNYASFDKWVSLDKTTQHLEFIKSGIPIVDSFVFGSKESALEWASKENNFPFIVKDNLGSCGTEVWKIKNLADLETLLTDYTNKKMKRLLFQKFLEGGEDLRVIVLEGKIVGAIKRIAQKGNYLTNYSQGGDVEKYDIENDPEATEIALKVADHFLLDYCGVDLMRNSDGKWVCLEVNRACQFEGFEKATGIDVAQKVTDFLTK